MNVLVIGGTGVISREIVRQLSEDGIETTIVNRGSRKVSVPGTVEVLTQDRSDQEAFAALFEKRYFDAVIDMVAFTAEEAQQTVDLFRNRCGQIMIVSSVAAYVRPLRSVPTLEEDVQLWESDEYSYGFEKARMERYLFEQIEAGAPVTIVRPSLTFGDGARNVGVLRQNAGILERIRTGKPLVMFGDGTHAWSFTFTPDLARMMIRLLGKSASLGQVFQLVNQERSNWLDLYLEFGRIVGEEPKILHVPSRVLYDTDPALFGHIYFEKSHPGLFSDSKYRRVSGDTTGYIDLARGLRDLADSWKRDGLEPDPQKDAMEDAIAGTLQKAYRELGSVDFS